MSRHKKKPSRSLSENSPKRDRLLNYIEALQAQGRLVFTSVEAQKALFDSPNAFIKASLRLIRKDKLFRPTNGFYVIIPTEYRSGKSVPPEWYIDALMKFHGLPYYVGGLSAAALHGAAHQAPQELQVITTKPLRLVTAHRTRIRFLTKKALEKTPVQEMKTHTGYFKVSTPEATAFDLVRYYRWAGYLNNVTTVLAELSERLDPKKLVDAAIADGEIAQAQRLGFLLEKYGEKKTVSELRKWVSKRETKLVPLRPGWNGDVLARDERWRVLVNDEVETDL
ncbi:type IV toxin-antitoxin system AbiEi family antitoxin [Bdellovibrionota bacterium FG-1]